MSFEAFSSDDQLSCGLLSDCDHWGYFKARAIKVAFEIPRLGMHGMQSCLAWATQLFRSPRCLNPGTPNSRLTACSSLPALPSISSISTKSHDDKFSLIIHKLCSPLPIKPHVPYSSSSPSSTIHPFLLQATLNILFTYKHFLFTPRTPCFILPFAL